MESHRHMTCILRVDTQSSGWEKSVTKVIKCVKDVSYTIDAAQGIVRISGEIDPHKLLTDIKKAGKHAELIQADCGGGGGGGRHFHSNYGYGYEYNGGYGNSEPHTNYRYYESKPVHGYIQSQYEQPHHESNGLLASAPYQQMQWHAPSSQGYDPYNPSCDPYNPSCNIM